jgi:hypothetical protein
MFRYALPTLLAASCLLACQAFSTGPARVASTGTQAQTQTVTTSTSTSQRSWCPVAFKSSSSSSSLAMGVMNDFLTGQDSSKRASDNENYLATLQQRVERINRLEADVEELGDDELEQKTSEFRERLAKGEDLNGSLLEETFAVVREAAWYVHIRLLYLVCVCVCVCVYAAAECCY